MNEKYHVIIWDTHEIYKTFNRLSAAKRCARGLGHTGEDIRICSSYPPIAYVGNDEKEVIYRPYFGKNIGASLSDIVNSNDDCLRG